MAVELLYGSPLPIDHTPESAVTAGDVIVVNGKCRIAPLDIAAGALGSVNVPNSGAVYQCDKSTGTGHAIADGAAVYWDAADEEVTYTADSGTNKQIGTALGDYTDSDTYMRFLHS